MMKRKIEIDPKAFPAELRKVFQNANVYDSNSHSCAKVFYCDTGYYVKVDAKGELAQEAALGRLFHSRGLGVEVTDYISQDKDYLVTRSAAGEDSTHYLEDPKRLCEVLAKALLCLHGQAVGEAPVSSRMQRYIDSVNGDASGGYYDESVLMDRFRVHSKEEAWAIMQENKDRLQPRTLIHGDACLSNVMLKDWKFSSFIDFNMAGMGDKHIDLYWAVKSLEYNLKTDRYADYFLDAYGREGFHLDMLKVVAAFELFG